MSSRNIVHSLCIQTARKKCPKAEPHIQPTRETDTEGERDIHTDRETDLSSTLEEILVF